MRAWVCAGLGLAVTNITPTLAEDRMAVPDQTLNRTGFPGGHLG